MIEGFARTPSSRAHPALSRAYSPFPFNQVLWTLLLLVTREYVLSNIAVVELIFFLICGAVRQNNVNWPFVVVLVWFCCLRSIVQFLSPNRIDISFQVYKLTSSSVISKSPNSKFDRNLQSLCKPCIPCVPATLGVIERKGTIKISLLGSCAGQSRLRSVIIR